MAWTEGARERERLERIYAEMGDGELLGLAATAGDLTEVAQGVLGEEMRRRGLESGGGAEEEAADISELGGDGGQWRTVHVFQQTFEAQAAFRLMEREGIEFAVEDRTVDEKGDMVAGPAIQLALLVDGTDWERTVRLLRREAGLFPEAVTDPRGAADREENEEGEEVVVVGEFEDGADVEDAGRVLGEAGVWFRMATHAGEEWERTSVEVRVEDQDRALESLATLLGGEHE